METSEYSGTLLLLLNHQPCKICVICVTPGKPYSQNIAEPCHKSLIREILSNNPIPATIAKPSNFPTPGKHGPWTRVGRLLLSPRMNSTLSASVDTGRFDMVGPVALYITHLLPISVLFLYWKQWMYTITFWSNQHLHCRSCTLQTHQTPHLDWGPALKDVPDLSPMGGTAANVSPVTWGEDWYFAGFFVGWYFCVKNTMKKSSLSL